MKQDKALKKYNSFLIKYHEAIKSFNDKEQELQIFVKVAKTIEKCLNIKLYDEQIICAKALLENKVIEMNTGEGKTFSAILAAGVYYLSQNKDAKITVITYNDYLAKRDSELAKKCLSDLGIEVGCSEVKSLDEKKKAYSCDIVYCTVTTLMDDYVASSITTSPYKSYEISFDYAIIDEADGVMITQARTNFIKSKKKETPFANMLKANLFVSEEIAEEDYQISKNGNGVSLTDSGVTKEMDFFNFDNLNQEEQMDVRICVNNSLRAHFYYKKNIHYVVQGKEVKLINSSTGRIDQDSTYVAGLHQAIEIKEGLDASSFSEIMAAMTYQGLLSKFNKLAGMSGTILDDAEEFYNVYGLRSVRIEPHFKNIRIDNPDLIFVNKKDKYKSLIQRVCKENDVGRPVLIGVPSTELSEEISKLLTEENRIHSLLNANKHAEEADAIAKAGQVGAITVATNMAGRGTDIIVSDEVNEKMGGLLILGVEHNNNKRADKQLLGRTARQGMPGETQFYISLDDDFAKNFNGTSMLAMASVLKKQEDFSIKLPIVNILANEAQKTLDGQEFDARKEMIKMYKTIDAEVDYLFSINKNLLLYEPIIVGDKNKKSIKWKESVEYSVFTADEREELSNMVVKEIGEFVRKNLELRSKIRFSSGIFGSLSTFKKVNEKMFEEAVAKINNILIQNIK